MLLTLIVLAPSEFNSYDGVMFPTVADAIYLEDWDLVQNQINYVSLFVNAAANTMKPSDIDKVF